MSHHLLLIIHLLAATIWVGGHLVLLFGILPGVMRTRNQNTLLDFERKYEPVGLTAMAISIITGIMLSYKYGVTVSQWFHFANPIENVVSIKLLLLFTTVLFALSAQIRVLPKLKHSNKKLPEMAVHIFCVSMLGVSMLIVGSFVRFGGA